MKDEMLHLFAFWSGWFLRQRGSFLIHEGVRAKLLEYISELDQADANVADVRSKLCELRQDQVIPIGHPFNQAMLRLLTKNEVGLGPEFAENIRNIKHAMAQTELGSTPHND